MLALSVLTKQAGIFLLAMVMVYALARLVDAPRIGDSRDGDYGDKYWAYMWLTAKLAIPLAAVVLVVSLLVGGD